VFAIARMNEKKMKPLGVSTGKRISSLPDIPTLQEAGVAGIDMNLWWLSAAPAGTPQPVVNKLHEWFTAIGKDPETKAFLGRFGAEPWTASLAETKALVDKEIKDWDGYVKVANIPKQ
jgi:tripartite-type tricarboxylate transporter receptor subunit TctC